MNDDRPKRETMSLEEAIISNIREITTMRHWRRLPIFLCIVAQACLFGCLPAPTPSGDWETTQVAGMQALQKGRYVEAEALINTALRQAEPFGPKDPRLARTLMNQGFLYYNQKRHVEAEAVWSRASAIFEESLGPNDRDFAASLTNLGLVYSAQGRPAEAEPFLRRALTIDEKAWGVDHPEVSVDLNNLGGFYLEQKKYLEAEPFLRRALTIRQKAVGPDHISMAGVIDNYARLLKETDHAVQAAELEERAKTLRSKHQH